MSTYASVVASKVPFDHTYLGDQAIDTVFDVTKPFDLDQSANLSFVEMLIDGQVKRAYNVPGDGNCFFSSISLAMYGNFSHSQNFRELVCGHISRNWGNWRDLVSLHHDNIHDEAQYRRKMVYSNGWATSAEIQATCHLLNIDITVFIKDAQYHRDHEGNLTHRYFQQNLTSTNALFKIELLLFNEHFSPLGRSNNMIQNSSGSRYENGLNNKKRRLPNDLPVSSDSAKRSNIKCTENKEKTVPQPAPADNTELNISQNKSKQSHTHACDPDVIFNIDEADTYQKCRKLGLPFLLPQSVETTYESRKRRHLNITHIRRTEKKYGVSCDNLPPPHPAQEDSLFNKAMDCIRAFEVEQLSYSFKNCNTCHERRLNMSMKSDDLCSRCYSDKNLVKMYSTENCMNPRSVPTQLSDMSIVEQQLIARLAPVINIHLLKHGGIAANGHCITFPQNVNEPAHILPNLPENIKILRVSRTGANQTTKQFNVRRNKVEEALHWLKNNNPAYSDIIISRDRINSLPENGEIETELIQTSSVETTSDDGPAPDQTDPGDVNSESHSAVPLPDNPINVSSNIEKVLEDAVNQNSNKKRKHVTIPWPTQDSSPLSEFTTKYFFTLSFPCLFPYSLGDYHINRPRTCISMSDWVEHLMWYEDGRFAQHPYFKFIVHNIIMRKRTLEQSSYIIKQQLGDNPPSLSELKEILQNGNTTIAKKILYFGATLRGTQQYWSQRHRELRSLVKYQINEGNGLPSFFTTGSCAEYYFKPLKSLLQQYLQLTSGQAIDLDNKNNLFSVLQKNTHIVSKYFDLRTMSYFKHVMCNLFGVNAYWYRQEFAKSRGMVHWHGLCWRQDKEPHNLLHEAIKKGLSDGECAQELAEWAQKHFGLTALHPAGVDGNNIPRKDLWAPPEGTANPPPEEHNPLLKLLMDVSDTQESLLEDHLLLSNKINLHRCSSYCLKSRKGEKVCRMEFGTEKNPGKTLRSLPAIVTDKNGSLRLEMPRDHPMLVQHSKFHTQGWRANGDISLILSKSSPENPSVNEIIATEKYITGYACKGNEQTGSVIDFFNDIVQSADQNSGTSTKSVCTKLLMNTVKRDISSMEAAYELTSLPLYRCSHDFQSISFTGSRVLEAKGHTLTKSTPLDKYLARQQEDKSSWYQFVCKQGKVPVMSGCSMHAVWPVDEDYARSILLLHWPNWRKISDIKEDGVSWRDVFETFLTSDICPLFVKADIERAKRNEAPEIDPVADQEDNTSDSDEIPPSWMELLQPQPEFDSETDVAFDDGGPDFDWSEASTKYPSNLGLKFIEQLAAVSPAYDTNGVSEDSLLMLNEEQRFAFNLVMHTLVNYQSKNPAFDPLRLIVSGTAGSGKSFLIKCLVFSILKLLQNPDAFQVLCPTGNSANLISGRTIHDFLKIPVQKKTRGEFSAPEGATAQTLQGNCRSLQVLIIDERSLVGSSTLGWMEYHCRFGLNELDKSWGGLPVVIFLGDDVQLPPVCDVPVYSSNKCSSHVAMHGQLVWKEFKTVVNLKTVVRQNENEEDLKNVLYSLRNYSTTPNHVAFMQKFQWEDLKLSHGQKLMDDIQEKALFVFPTHDAEFDHNRQCLLKVNKYAPVAKLSAENSGPHAKSAQSDKAMGLLHTLYLCIGAKVMLTSNLSVQYGLFNGSMGVVQDIIYMNNRHPKDSLPDVVMVFFDKYNGPPFSPENPKLVPIVPVERRIDCFCKGCKRKQVPLRLGWGTTIHRCQGMTIGKGELNRYIVIHPGSKSFESRNPGALFVALSRAKTAGSRTQPPDFAWNPQVLINEDRLCHIVATPTVKSRDKEVARLASLSTQTKIMYKDFNNKQSFMKILKILNSPIRTEE